MNPTGYTTERYRHERLRSPKGLYHLRTVKQGKHRIIIGCPTPTHKGKCPVGTVGQAILHPIKEGKRNMPNKLPADFGNTLKQLIKSGYSPKEAMKKAWEIHRGQKAHQVRAGLNPLVIYNKPRKKQRMPRRRPGVFGMQRIKSLHYKKKIAPGRYEYDFNPLSTMRGDRRKMPLQIKYRNFTMDDIRQMATGQHYGKEFAILDRNNQIARVRLASKVKTWKTDPNRFEATFKFGLYESFRLDTQGMLDNLIILENPQRMPRRRAGVFGMQAVKSLHYKKKIAPGRYEYIFNPKGSVENYGRVLELRAQKTKGEFAGQSFRHPFKTQVKAIGLPDGSVLLKSVSGHRLWSTNP